MKLKILLSIILLFLALLSSYACQRQADQSLTIPAEPATLEVEVQQTPTQTSNQPEIQPTATIVPTLRPKSTATPKVTPSVTPDLRVSLLSAEDFDDNRNPLTGELVSDPEILLRRPIAVKISNSPAKYTRPQSGLSQADLVFEHVTEVNITRFTAIFYDETPEKIGPIRSARLIDLELPAMYDAALAYSGSSISNARKLFSSDFASRILRSHEPGYYRTGEDKPYEHTLYAHPEEFWPALESKGENRKPNFSTNLTFTTEPPPGGESVNSVQVEYRNFSVIDWIYDSESGRFLRWADGEKHTDANTGEQISAANVIVLLVPHSIDPNSCENQSGDVCLAYSVEIQLWGSGPAFLLRDGLQYEVTWRRANRSDMLTFVDENGLAVPLQIGNTWFQVISINHPESYRVVN
jgi:hypothetical protein